MRTTIPGALRLACAAISVLAAGSTQEKAEFAGRVLDEHGAPLAGVAVCPLPQHDHWWPAELAAAATVKSDGDGRFRVAIEQGAATEVLFVARGHVHAVQQLDHLAVWPVQLGKARTLSGRVRNADGAAVVGARVVATDFLRNLHILQDQGRGDTQEELRAVARTDETGRFVLPGAYGTAMRLRITKAGCRDLELAPVSVLDPLDLTLTQVGAVEGVVIAADGTPAAGVLVTLVTHEEPRVWRSTRTDAQGRYALTWTERPARLSVTRSVDGSRQSAQRDIDVHGSYELRLATAQPRTAPTPDPAVATTPKVTIAATGPDGAPVARFRVAVFRIDPTQQRFRTDRRQLEDFAAAAVDGAAGAAIAPIREDDDQGGLLVLARAEGCALARVVADADAKEVEIRFEKAAPVVGKVLDRSTNAPVAGARLWFLPDLDGKNQHQREFEVLGESGFRVTSGEDGSFVLADPPRGEGRVFVVADGYEPRWTPCEVGVQDGALQVLVDRLVAGQGRLVVAPLPTAFVGVRPLRTRPGTGSTDHQDLQGLVPLRPDGAMEFTGLAPVEHHFELVSMRAPRQGRPDKLMIGSLQIAPGLERIELDGKLARPARVRGRVTGPVPAQRLAVLCSPVHEGNFGYSYLQYRGPLCPLDIDGSYDIRELPGERILAVIDIDTGVLFARGGKVMVAPGGERTQDFPVDAAPLRIRVVRGEGEGQGGDQFVELLPPQEFWPGGLGQIVPHDGKIEDYCLGMGMRVPAGVDEVTLWLPKVPFQFTLRAYCDFNGARAQSPHGSVVSAEPGRDTTVTVGW